jgi:hypothetical protein
MSESIPTTIAFAEPPGKNGTLVVSAEQGDIEVHVAMEDKPSCTLVLTMDNALTLSMWLVAHVVDERRRRQQGPFRLIDQPAAKR